ncbi:hypothetical protein ACLOJK_026590 [Asimina triloba]
MNHNFYIVHFSGQSIAATVTDMPRLDCEWRPHPIPDKSNTAAILQPCTQNKCPIAQLFDNPSLKAFLRDSNVTFVGVGVDEDALKLGEEHGLEVASACDPELLAVAYND